MWLQGILADVSIYTGYLTICLMLGGRFIFQWFGWRVAAALTPLLMLLSGGAFFAFSLFGSGTASAMASTGAAAGAVTQVAPPAPSRMRSTRLHPHPAADQLRHTG